MKNKILRLLYKSDFCWSVLRQWKGYWKPEVYLYIISDYSVPVLEQLLRRTKELNRKGFQVRWKKL